MRKIVINNCYGGFGLSEIALEMLGIEDCYDMERDNPRLIEVVENLGSKADGLCSELRIVEIPENVEWHIEDYDGSEWVAENHRTWH